MIRKTLVATTFAGFLALAGPVVAQDSNQALIDALVKKGILSQKDASKIEAEVAKEATEPSSDKSNLGSKIKLGSWVKELDISGDFRLRNQWDQQQAQIPGPATATGAKGNDIVQQRDRWRFRLRLNIDMVLENNFFVGVQLASSDTQTATSQNATYTNGYDPYSIYINRAFIGWRPEPGMTFVVGKQENPFYTTDLFWSPDVSPQGLVERFDFDKLFGWNGGNGGEPVADYSKVGKEPTPTPAAPKPDKFELALIAGQFVFYNNNLNNAWGEAKYDAFQFETQLKAKWTGLGGKLSITEAPAVFIANAATIGAATNGFNSSTGYYNQPASIPYPLHSAGFPITNRGEFFILAPGDITYKFGNLPVALYWDFSYNAWGNERWRAYGPLYSDVSYNAAGKQTFSNQIMSPQFRDNVAWLAGLRIGANKKAGDWSMQVDYRQVGIDAIDPNLDDDNINLSYLNFQGVTAGFAYNLTDFLTLGVRGLFTWNLRENLYGGFANGGTVKVANLNSGQVIQVDLNMKF
jgi:polyhydroxyalkanoate synthesis regulator phasin